VAVDGHVWGWGGFVWPGRRRGYIVAMSRGCGLIVRAGAANVAFASEPRALRLRRAVGAAWLAVASRITIRCSGRVADVALRAPPAAAELDR